MTVQETPAGPAPWRIKVGEKLPRPQIHAAYGGRPRTRISPCSGTSANVLLFAEPACYPGCSDGWTRITDGGGEDVRFLFHGEGPAGDQELTRGNRTLHDAATGTARPVRLFTPADGGWEYQGRFVLAPRDRAPGRNGLLYLESDGAGGQERVVLGFLLARRNEAAVVLGEDTANWIVECERTGCRQRMLAPKRTGIPLDPYDHKTAIRWEARTYPVRRWCHDHPPHDGR